MDRPPAPPALPPTNSEEGKVSIALKVRTAPPGWALESQNTTSGRDSLPPPASKYFFYGTLQDPRMLREILNLNKDPILQPAHLIGYRTRLWGQYPAVVKEPNAFLKGHMFEVPDEQSSQKLADYETKSYHPVTCIIRLGIEPDTGEQVEGFVFEYCGNRNDLSDGTFDLNVWLARMGRAGGGAV